MKTLRLDLDYDYDFELYGIVSSSKEYTLAWALNKCFNFRLIKQKDLCFDFISKGRLVISNYLHRTEHYSIRLFRNKSVDLSTLKKPFLVPDIKEYDYVVQISGGAYAFIGTGTFKQTEPGTTGAICKKIRPGNASVQRQPYFLNGWKLNSTKPK